MAFPAAQKERKALVLVEHEMTIRIVIDGVQYKFAPSGVLVPDYSVPGVRERINQSVDEAYDAQWSIDRRRQ